MNEKQGSLHPSLRVVFSILAMITLPFLLIIRFVEWVVNAINSLIEWNERHQLDYVYDKTKDFRFFRVNDRKERGPSGTFFVEHWYGESKTAQNNRVFFYFLFPSLFAFSLFVALPFFQGIWFSLTNWNGINNGHEKFIWFDNYSTIFTDYGFVFSFIRTAIYAIMNILAINLVAFGLALLVTRKLALKNIYRAAFFMPNLIGGLVLGFIWQFIYNRAIVSLGGIFSTSILINGNSALFGLILVVTWQYAGYIMMIYIAALQNVPQDLIEASKIDGASAWQRLRAITFPMIAQSFTIAMFLTLTTSFKQFDTVVSLTQGGPAMKLPLWISGLFNIGSQPVVQSTDLIAFNIWDEAYNWQNLGIGQAKAIVFFVVLLIVSIVQVRLNQRREVEL